MRAVLLKTVKENWILSLAFLITMLVYFKLLFFGAISWDDPEMVFKNQHVKSFDLLAFFKNHYVGNYIPITMLIHALGWFIFQEATFGHHLISILFHLLNGYLVYQITKALFNDKNISLISVIVFLLHPLQTESVAWISELKTLTSATFLFGSTLFYIHFLKTKKNSFYLLSLLLYCLASLSKPSVLMLPFILFGLEWYLIKNITTKSALKLLPYLFISTIIAYVTIQTQIADQFINHSHEFNFFVRFGFAGLALFNYLLLFFVPLNQSVIYSYPMVNNTNMMAGYFCLASIGVFVIYLIKTKKFDWLIASVFFIFNLLLVLQFIPFGEALFADRYMYISIIGLAWLVAFVLQKIKFYKATIVVLLLLINATFAYSRLQVWKSALLVYEDILKKYPNQFVALNSAGVECMMLNEDQKSLAYFRKAVKEAPNNYKGFYNMGLLFLKNNQPDQAIESFNRSIHLYEYQKAYAARASAYYMMNDLPKAINDANKVLTIQPQNAKAHFILGNCYNDLNQMEKAIQEYNFAIEQNGEESDYYFKRAIALGKMQKFNDCLNDLIVCLELNPNNFEAHYWKGVSLVNLKRNPCEDFKVAAQHNFEPAVSAYYKYCH